VVVVDLRPTASTTNSDLSSDSLSGEFILKLDERTNWGGQPELPESERHKTARATNSNFADNHIPHLVRSLEFEYQTALLYEIAGSGLAGVVTADRVDAGALGERGAQLADDLFRRWNRAYKIENISTGSLLDLWLGYRLDPHKAPRLHEFLKERTHNASVFIEAGHVLVNPH